MVDLWWVSWVLLAAGVLGVTAWVGLGIWWFRRDTQRKNGSMVRVRKLMLEKPIIESSVEEISTRTNKQIPLRNGVVTAPDSLGLTKGRSLVFTGNPENLMWRPPSRESLLHRQQARTKLGGFSEHAESARPLGALSIPKRSPLPPFPRAEPVPIFSPPTDSIPKIAYPDSRIGRQRQGLESLVNLLPLVEHDESRTS